MKNNTFIETEPSTSSSGRFSTTTLLPASIARVNPMNKAADAPKVDMPAVKVRQKATWESGDFGQVARFIIPAAEDFMARIDLQPGARVLDAACGTGNLAVIAAGRGCRASGLDIATNLLVQARERAKQDGFAIEFTEGDVESMPYEDASFDVVVSMFGVMFAPQPDRVVSELCRVT